MTIHATSEIDLGPAEMAPPGTVRTFERNSARIAVYNVAGQLFAMDDLCTHDEAFLSDGDFDPSTRTVRCPRHSSRFDLTTGRPKSLPALRPVRTYPARIVDGRIKVGWDP
ncbi:MAG: non-heme iron oxygenase ferredoxin subunit [Actinobacteria bacterium]|nr:non-heme iron oxygenase ferredoxin subunit [Actinomycetota bacterium]